MTDVTSSTLLEARSRLRSGEVTSVDLTSACLEQVRRLDAAIFAFLFVSPDAALEQARRADRALTQWRKDQALPRKAAHS